MKPVSTVSASSAETVRVWDPLVRIFHWSLVLVFFGAYALGDDGDWWHQALGYTALGLVAFRLAWGLVGTQYARFSSFVPTPRKMISYLKDLVARREARHLGHNPAGAVMIVALLLMLIGTGTTGWLLTSDAFWGSEALEEVHEGFANGTLFLVGLHIVGVIFSSLRHRENLVRAMVTGRKRVKD
ncbi:cytochrome B561 [Steroidobacter denitrificans]|jgi:cytochrome b|uniref:Cytochrome B561 n=1 Tax=Steroidobacter denitrificans TaxID=465721 RepID=A0A127FCB9_STEDE|nr:cytochrome b/b6 domain-containing protein [Steroidobacter denitrificans]AMN48047.1 cytochrome B561 [Steroidobacter denitrificans]